MSAAVRSGRAGRFAENIGFMTPSTDSNRRFVVRLS
jgi:ribosomal protein S16